jgi:GNAT superfamily N-acetyltransferase
VGRVTTVTIDDGSRLAIRPIEPDDRNLLAAGFERLSPESRYRRFLAPVAELSDRQLDYLTRVDHHDHEALVAIDSGSGHGVAVARFIRVGEGIAEPAIAVVDEWQGRGVGGALLDVLAERAREEGIHRFAALVLAHNARAIKVLEGLGEARSNVDGPEVELEIDLAEPIGASAAFRRVLDSVSAGAVQPALTLWHRVAARRGPRAGVLENTVVVEVEPSGVPGDGLGVAAAIARASRASLHLVTAQTPMLDDQDELELRLGRVARGLDGVAAIETHVRRSEPATALLDVAVEESARLIVVSDSGAPDPSERFLGPVWRHVSHHAPCDVLIARRRPDGGGPR